MEEIVINEPYGFIYITTNMIDGKKYLGQKKFIKGWETYLGSGTDLNLAIDEYGAENFSREIICICASEEELNQAEYDLSVFLNVVDNSDWYNLCYGGGVSSGYKHSDEGRAKMSTSSKIRWSNIEERRKYSEMHKKENLPAKTYEKMVESIRNRAQDEQWKAKIGAKSKERLSIPENNPMYGKNHTEESKKKMSESHIGMHAGDKNPMHGRTWWNENTPPEKINAWKANISTANSGANNPNYGVKCTEEKRTKLIASNPRTKSVAHINSDHQIIATYRSMREAYRKTGIDRKILKDYCDGIRQPLDGTSWILINKTQQNELIKEN